MNPKEFALDVLGRLPETTTIKDLKYEFRVIIGLLEGLRDVDEGRTIPHEQAMAEVREWMLTSTGRRDSAVV
jgi:hypothetical protein